MYNTFIATVTNIKTAMSNYDSTYMSIYVCKNVNTSAVMTALNVKL